MQKGVTYFFENLAAMYQNIRRHIPPLQNVLFNTYRNYSLISRVEKKCWGGIRIFGYYNIVIILNKIGNYGVYASADGPNLTYWFV